MCVQGLRIRSKIRRRDCVLRGVCGEVCVSKGVFAQVGSVKVRALCTSQGRIEERADFLEFLPGAG